MEIAVTGSSGLIGTALLAALRASRASGDPGGAAGERVRRRQPSTGIPAAGTIDAAGLRGARRGRAPRRRRASATSAGPPEQKRRILESRTGPTTLLAETLAGLDQAAARARVGIGDRLVRQPRRRGAHRGEPAAEPAGLPLRRLPAVGGRDRAGRGGRHPHGASAHRDRARGRRRGAQAHAAAVPARARRPHRLRAAST